MERDVIIVGGGLVGASLALALRALDLQVTLVEGFAPDAADQPSFDERTTALGNGTRRIFEALGVWERIAAEAAPIRRIHVSDRGRFGFARLEAAEQGIEAFGYVVANRVMGRALWDALRAPAPGAPGRIELRMPARPEDIEFGADAVQLFTRASAPGSAALPARARLLVAADGAQSNIRELAGIASHVEDYGQSAVVVNVGADRPNDGTAFERFTPTGPLAVLPLHDGSYTFVWTLAPAHAASVLALPDADFLAQLQRSFGWRAGRLTRAGRRSSYGLALTRADAAVARRTVLIGNASQALHPVAGQGFNLGIRDAATLAEVLAEAQAAAPAEQRFDAGAATLLEAFAERREDDRRGVTRFTDSLVKLFRDERPGVGLARNLGLLLFDLAPPAKSALSRLSWGFSGRAPRLARGLPLR